MAERKEVIDTEENLMHEKSKLKLIIIATLVLFIGAVGILAYNKSIKNTEARAVTQKAENVGIVCPLKSFVVNLLDKRGLGKRYLKVTLEVEVAKEEDRQLIDRSKPKIRDSILLLLSNQELNEINTIEGKLALKQDLLSKMKQILGEGVVRRIYFTEFIVQ